MTKHDKQFYIDGQWVEPIGKETLEVINPATEQPIATIALGNEKDVDRAVAAARRAISEDTAAGAAAWGVGEAKRRNAEYADHVRSAIMTINIAI